MVRFKVFFPDADAFYACRATKGLLVSPVSKTLINDAFIAGWYLFTERGFGLDGPVKTEEELWTFQRTEGYLEIEALPTGYVFS